MSTRSTAYFSHISLFFFKGWARARKGAGEAAEEEHEHLPTLVQANTRPPQLTPHPMLTHAVTRTGVSVVRSSNRRQDRLP